MSNLTLGPAMRELPDDERPREKLLRYGSSQLANRDLLAILLVTGTRSLSALGLADRLMARFGSLAGVLEASVEELTGVPGVGVAKAAQISAAGEVARRLQGARPYQAPIRSAADVVEWIGSRLSRLTREEVWALLLDVKNRVIGVYTVAVGHLSGAPVHPRELFKEAVRRSSAALVVVHNHPSGDPTPSPDDLALTRRLREAGEILGISVLDHIIVGDASYVSLREQGHW